MRNAREGVILRELNVNPAHGTVSNAVMEILVIFVSKAVYSMQSLINVSAPTASLCLRSMKSA